MNIIIILTRHIYNILKLETFFYPPEQFYFLSEKPPSKIIASNYKNNLFKLMNLSSYQKTSNCQWFFFKFNLSEVFKVQRKNKLNGLNRKLRIN